MFVGASQFGTNLPEYEGKLYTTYSYDLLLLFLVLTRAYSDSDDEAKKEVKEDEYEAIMKREGLHESQQINPPKSNEAQFEYKVRMQLLSWHLSILKLV